MFYARQAMTCQLQGRLLQTPYKNYKTERMFKIYRLTSYYTRVHKSRCYGQPP